MYHQRRTPRRNVLSASLTIALGLSLAGTAGSAINTHHVLDDGHAVNTHDMDPTPVAPDRIVDAPAHHELQVGGRLSNSPIARGLISGDLDQQAQRKILDQLRALDEPKPDDATLSATLVVSNCDDSGYGSLRNAVANANDGDIIDLSNLSCSKITLSDTIAVEQDNLTLRGKLSFNEDDNKYEVSPLIDGQHNSNKNGILFHAGAGTLEVERLGLRGGRKYAAGFGGACVSSLGNISLKETEVKYCTSEDPDFNVYGGALFAAGDITLTRSEIRSSKVKSGTAKAYGGALFAEGRLTMTDSVLYNNSATSTDGSGYGGGAFVEGGATLRRVEIRDNNADVIGGATINTNNDPDADIYIKHALVVNNSSTGAGLSGGMYLSAPDSEIGLHNNTFIHNRTKIDTGAGVRINQGTLTMVSNLVSGNWWRPDPDLQYVADFWSNVPVSGSHNLVGYVDGPNQPPADTIQQFELTAPGLARGSWALNRGKFLADILDVIPAPPGCVVNPPIEYCLPTFILEPSIDQAGNGRTVGAGTDIGALESDALFVDGFTNPSRPWAD